LTDRESLNSSFDADLNAPAGGVPVHPPVITRVQVLPFGELTRENFERLCYRLAGRAERVEHLASSSPLLEERRDANFNTASFDRQGVLWFTGQNGIYGRLDPKTGAMAVFDAPRGTGPYGIATTPDGQVFFASLAGNYLGQIDLETGATTVLEPPMPRQGARRVWSDSRGALWITGWNSGDLFRYDSKSKTWARWHLPGDGPQPYAVYVDETNAVWVSDWGANAILRFDPKTEKFDSFPLPDRYAGVRQLAGRKGEVWGAESGADKLFVLKTE
jgi:virginiamycin B lyase